MTSPRLDAIPLWCLCVGHTHNLRVTHVVHDLKTESPT
jgi:hypothetical protein